jgi:hypothetical protein
MNVVGGPVVVDSSDSNAVVVSGSGTLSAPEFDITGTPGASGASMSGAIKGGMTPTPDPFSYYYTPTFNLPNPGALPLQSGSTKRISTGSVTLSQGLYIGGIDIHGDATVTMLPGVYYMQGGGFSYTSSGNLTANGVMLLNAPLGPTDQINIIGTGAVTMSPMTSGLLQGFTIFQDPFSVLQVNISGNGNMNITGTIYAPHGKLRIQGSGATNVIGSQYVCYSLVMWGTGSISVRRDLGTLGRARMIGIVE